MQAILIGFMGSGKTTVGQLLAHQLTTKHYDLDDIIIQTANQSITDIFAHYGETYFRKLEHKTLQQILQHPGILSTGGGTPIISANAALLVSNLAPIIWLTASDQVILKRLQNDTNRPLVQQLNQNDLLSLKAKRTVKYQAIADLTICTDQLTPLQIVQQITDWLS